MPDASWSHWSRCRYAWRQYTKSRRWLDRWASLIGFCGISGNSNIDTVYHEAQSSAEVCLRRLLSNLRQVACCCRLVIPSHPSDDCLPAQVQGCGSAHLDRTVSRRPRRVPMTFAVHCRSPAESRCKERLRASFRLSAT